MSTGKPKARIFQITLAGKTYKARGFESVKGTGCKVYLERIVGGDLPIEYEVLIE